MEHERRDLEEACERLLDIHSRFSKRELSSLDHSRQREDALAAALRALAAEHGVTLQEPLQINSRGEYALNVVSPDPVRQTYGRCGRYETLAAVLNQHNPRTGVMPGATLLPESGWCWMNHFDVERMVLQAYDQRRRDTEQVVARDRH